MGAPQTLPADFFDQQEKPPDTLPANFFESEGKPSESGKQFIEERKPENQEGFFRHGLTVLGRQVAGLGETLAGGPGAAYKGYEASRAAGKGVGESLGRGAAVGLLYSLPGMQEAYSYYTAPEAYRERRAKGYGRLYSALAPTIAPMVGLNLPGMEHEADIGNPRGVLAEAAVPAAETAGIYVGGRLAEAKYAPERQARLGRENISKALDTAPGRGGARAASMDKAIADTQADLAEIQRAAPGKAKGADAYHELAEKIDARQEEMWQKGHEPGIARHENVPIDPNRVVAAGKRVLTNEARDTAPQEAAAADKWLEGMAKERNLRSADKLIREINDDLKGKDVQSYGPLQVRVRQAVVKELRNEVDRVLTDSGEQGVREVNRRWGALDQIKDRVRERAVQLARAEAKEGPLPDWVHAYMFLHPGAAALPVSVGLGLRLARIMRPSPAGRLATGLTQLERTGLRAPFEAAPPHGWGRGPVGLLGPHPTELGAAPDISGPIRIGVPEGVPTTRAERLGLLLPERSGGGYQGPAPPPEPTPAPPPTRVDLINAGRMRPPAAPEPNPPPTPAREKLRFARTPQSVSLATYKSLPGNIREAVDEQAIEIPHMPQALREGRMRELEAFGGKGTPLKERLSREAAKYEGLEVKGAIADPRAELKDLKARQSEFLEQSRKARDWRRAQTLIRKAEGLSRRIKDLSAQLGRAAD